MKSNNHHHPIVTPYTPPHGITLLLLLLFLSPLASAQPPSDPSSSNGDYYDNNSNISPSMALIVVVLVLAFFITGAISLYVQCGGVSQSTAARLAGAAVSRSRRPTVSPGLDRSIIESFPTFVYSSVKELKIGKGSLECAVCLSEFEDTDSLRLLTKCDHVFHSDCIDTWLAAHTTCPVCRANLVPDSDEFPSQNADSETEPENSVSGEVPTGEVRVTIGEEIPKRKFPRSHSTGHSLSQPGDDMERFRLRLPADVRRQLVARAKLKRATSLVALPRATSSRRGYRGGAGEGSGSSRYGRLLGAFGLRVGSFRSTVKGDGDGDGDGTTSMNMRRVLGTAVTPVEGLPPLPPV